MSTLLEKLKSQFNTRGHEVPDPTPVTIPVSLRRSESMDERIARIVQHSLSTAAADQGMETFEEADDFDIPDDPIDPTTPYEQDFDLASVHASERGVVQAPHLDPQRYAEMRKQYLDPQPDPSPAPVKPQDDLLSAENA